MPKKVKDKTYICKGEGCGKEIRVKEVTPELAELKMCPQCYTKQLLGLPSAPAEEVCEFCGTVATKPEEYCSHLKAKHGLPLKRDGKEPPMTADVSMVGPDGKVTPLEGLSKMLTDKIRSRNQSELPGMPEKGEEALIAEDILDLRDEKKALNDKMKELQEKFITRMRLAQKSYLLVKGWNFEVDLKDTLTVTKKK